jgi:hypothetical protein
VKLSCHCPSTYVHRISTWQVRHFHNVCLYCLENGCCTFISSLQFEILEDYFSWAVLYVSMIISTSYLISFGEQYSYFISFSPSLSSVNRFMRDVFSIIIGYCSRSFSFLGCEFSNFPSFPS